MKWRHRLGGEGSAVVAGAALAVIGWVAHGRFLAVAGVLVVAIALVLWIWGDNALAGVDYVRTLSRTRATFGEQVEMDVEIINDKLLPLTWLHAREQVSASLRFDGGTVVGAGWRTELHFVVAMLPYQRLRRRITVHCDQRGVHTFGPAELRSGSPLGTREHTREVFNESSLLVYPKVVPLAAPLVAARVPIPERRVRQSLALDPTRVVGVRAYQPGDPVRHVDWRATARRGELLVRVHEPATTLGVAVFVDLLPPARTPPRMVADMIECIVSFAASVVSHLGGAGVPTGLFVNGTSRGRHVAIPASGDRSLPAMMDALARVSASGAAPMEHILLQHGSRLGAGTSAFIVAAEFSEPVSVAVAELRRRAAVSALWIATDHGLGPAPGMLDARWEARYDPGWRDLDVLDLTE